MPLLHPDEADLTDDAARAQSQSPLVLASRPVHIFMKGVESQQMAQSQERLQCNIAGSVFVQKLTAVKGQGAAKKRAKAPDFEEPSGKKP